jgi:NTE family protein
LPDAAPVDWLGGELEKAGVSTFAHLALEDPGASLADYQRYSLVVHTSDLSRRALVRLPWDYPQYGRAADAERVVDAVRASMSIPFYFRRLRDRCGDPTTALGARAGRGAELPRQPADLTTEFRSRDTTSAP